jgi:hydroxymethylbilane synthase
VAMPEGGGVRKLIVGTRGSDLARNQTEQALAPLRRQRPDITIEVRIIRTEGDRKRRTSLSVLGGTGVFVKEIERALTDGDIDLAIHSAKDLPPALAPGLTLAAVPLRSDARDALISRDGLRLAQLPPGSRIGTGSARRRAMLLLARPDLEVVDIRGNVETRIARVRDGSVDAVVLAAAGLARLGRIEEASDVLLLDVMLPAPGQGALAIEGRSGDPALAEIAAVLDDPVTHACVTAERGFLGRLGAGCTLPVGAYAQSFDGTIELRAAIVSADGSTMSAASLRGELDDAAAIGSQLAAQMTGTGFGSVEGVR